MEEQNINIGEITARILQACSPVKGLMNNEAQYQQVVIAFTFLRRIDCLIEQYAEESLSFYSNNRERLSDERLDAKLCEISGGYPFYNRSGYTFNKILLADNSIDVVLNSYLQGFSRNVQEILDGMNFKPLLGTLLRQSRYLVNIIQSFSDMDLSRLSIDNKEFVEIVTSLLATGQREIGLFYSDAKLSKLINECLLSKDIRADKDDNITIYDPVCGTGSMLAFAGEKAKDIAVHQDSIALYGQEIAIYPSTIAKALALLTGNSKSRIQYGDTLVEDKFKDQYFQYILADLPLGIAWKQYKDRIERESIDLKGRFSIGLPSAYDSQFLFIQHIIFKMNPNGSRVAFISNGLVLSGGSTQSGESRIRRWLFENDYVEAIIAIPKGFLPYTNVPVYLWILNNRKDPSKMGYIQLINGASDYINGSKDFVIKRIVDNYKHAFNDGITSKIISSRELGYYELNLLEAGGPTRRVTIDLNTDINDYIKQEVVPFAKGEISIDYPSVEKGYSVNFGKFFKVVVNKDNNDLNLDDLSMRILTLIEEFRSLEPDSVMSKNLIKDIVKEDNIQYGGTIKHAWPSYPLHFLAYIIKGQSKQLDGELPYITVSYLRDRSVQSGIHILKPKNRRDKIVTDYDVLLINTGANAGEIFKGVSGIPSSTLSIIRADEKVMSPKYLYYLLKGNEKYLRNLTKGFSIKNIDTRTLSNVRIQLPPIEVQNQIVGQLDKAIEKIDKIIDLLGGKENILTQYRQALIEDAMRGTIEI